MSEGPDDRITCRSCLECDAQSFRCRALKIGTLVDLPRRCEHYLPDVAETDRRTGAERWPTLDLQARR